VFLDETWATTSMSPTRGWAPKGERLVCTVPHGDWHTTKFLCGLRTTGLVAPLMLDSAVNGRKRPVSLSITHIVAGCLRRAGCHGGGTVHAT
jgi:hypothetical protein